MEQVRQKIDQEIPSSGWSMHGYIPSYSRNEREKRSSALGSQQMGLQFLHPQYQTVGCSEECVVLEANPLQHTILVLTDEFFRVSGVAAWQE